MGVVHTLAPFNMRFTLFFVDPRPAEAVRRELEKAFGTRFEKDGEYALYGRLRYTADVLGLELSCEREEIWEDGAVYRFCGNNDVATRILSADEVDIGFHVRSVVGFLDPVRVLTFDEFCAVAPEERARRQGKR
jgi:hypothetical protein